MAELKDLTGRRFGRLIVLEHDHTDQRGKTYWRCLCDCGRETIILGYNLSNGHTTSCGCKHRTLAAEDLTGMRFGRLVVLGFDRPYRNVSKYWRCLCDCGRETSVLAGNLVTGLTTSCGCRRVEAIRESTTKHGMSNSSLYRIWYSMNRRCSDPDHIGYKNYGARGIAVCNEWDNFENFRDWALDNGYEDGLSIDRINNDDGYHPENCRWVDQITQQNNRRNNRYVTWNNITHTIAEWSRMFDVNDETLRRRVINGNMKDFEEYFKEEN